MSTLQGSKERAKEKGATDKVNVTLRARGKEHDMCTRARARANTLQRWRHPRMGQGAGIVADNISARNARMPEKRRQHNDGPNPQPMRTASTAGGVCRWLPEFGSACALLSGVASAGAEGGSETASLLASTGRSSASARVKCRGGGGGTGMSMV